MAHFYVCVADLISIVRCQPWQISKFKVQDRKWNSFTSLELLYITSPNFRLMYEKIMFSSDRESTDCWGNDDIRWSMAGEGKNYSINAEFDLMCITPHD